MEDVIKAIKDSGIPLQVELNEETAPKVVADICRALLIEAAQARKFKRALEAARSAIATAEE